MYAREYANCFCIGPFLAFRQRNSNSQRGQIPFTRRRRCTRCRWTFESNSRVQVDNTFGPPEQQQRHKQHLSLWQRSFIFAAAANSGRYQSRRR